MSQFARCRLVHSQVHSVMYPANRAAVDQARCIAGIRKVSVGEDIEMVGGRARGFAGVGRTVRRAAVLALAIALLSGASVAAGPPAARDIQAAQRALSATFGGNSDDYTLVAERDVSAGGVRIWAAKFADRRTGDTRLIYRDQHGRTGGPELLQAALDRGNAGLSPLERKASRDLIARAERAEAGERLPVAIWMGGIDTTAAVARVIAAHPEGRWIGDRPDSGDIAIQRRLRHALDEARAAVYAAAAAEIERAIAKDGGTVGYVGLLGPLVYVDVPARSLARLASHPRVQSLGLEGMAGKETLASAGPYVHADWHAGDLDQGIGVRVGIIEYYNVRAIGDLAGKVVASHSTSGVITNTPAGVFDHPTWVAGAVASQDAVDKGIAPGAVIVSSSTGGGVAGLARDQNVIRAADWAATAGDADILNVSLNMDSAGGRDQARAYFDSIAGGETFRTVVVSAGNYNTGVDAPQWWVSSPGTSWNVLTVGGVNDGNNTLWYDGVCPCSGALWDENPAWAFNTHGDFNKPNVSAPAVSVRTANGLSASGTSVASPITAGIAAQIFARNAAVFGVWPEAMRSIIMAGANRRVPLPGGGVNTDHEGVGTVETLWSHRVYVNGVNGGWAKGNLLKGAALSQTFTVAAGQKVRIALTWDSHTAGAMFTKTDTLTADLDLSVNYPGGAIASSSWDNSYEFVSFTAPQAGDVTITVRQPRFDRASEFWSLAWLKW
jgi:hypothetical protein